MEESTDKLMRELQSVKRERLLHGEWLPEKDEISSLKRPETQPIAVSRDWEKLSKEQQLDVQALRERINAHQIAETESFYKEHPELQLTWSFTLDALIRGNHDSLARE